MSVPFVDEISSSAKREYYANQFRALDSMIYLTYRCTSRCKTCNIWKRNAEGSDKLEMGWEKWRIILERLAGYGIKTLEIFGGDALLRKDIIYDVVRYCTDNGIETYFPTNSLLLDREAARRFVEAGLHTIYFSLDDVEANNDEIRGQSGAFEMVTNAIENLCSERGGNRTPRIIVCTTISNMNYNHFEDIVKFLKKYPVDAVYPRVVGEFTEENIEASVIEGVKPEPYFATTDSSSHLLTKEQLREFRETVKRLASMKDCGQPYINTRAVDTAGDDAFTRGIHPDRKCLICSTFVTIDPAGNVVPCPMYNKYSIGNLLDSPLEDIWGSMKHRRFVQHQRDKDIKICANCVMRGYYPTLSETCSYMLKKAMNKAAS